MKRVALVLALAAAIAGVARGAASSSSPAGHDWARFGYDTARRNASPDATITAANVSKLRRRRVMKESPVSILVVHPPLDEKSPAVEPAPLPATLSESN